ncbi:MULTISPECIES: transketolase [Nocardiopsis]|uniref:Transketolase n=1 Tax=Nocardiopsis dassonvillei (strain ATCC 23218 / DSM 43111 / CIP 107115 / JCM 7437 / KCTC 9190 / NBRC 14626 / NCTC 10488 / NRRL B-5397 / IMRU 509) TaxID=446468 RepID=D7B0Z9_NOCDD|nr:MULTISPECIES: transketolase [Nocardiopsis]ADH68384.1 transketolase [Nocardiopsis dassonvillei subsp. dassonvillei DSM 43111]APC36486.1 transketolase [Nocardiopsis dassonvillei]NKY81787.1 transketolase [Nocardiopsis dassonvillei]VEI88889.1 Transketolase [Nocardiopsis dassonvillei]
MNAHTPQTLEWSDLDLRAVNTVRALAMDAVEKSGNGHPGTAMSLAPAAYLLFQKIMRHDPSDPEWTGRDRFVLSIGHSSLTLYIQLYLAGYGLELDDLKNLRQWGSRTPGHPEFSHTPGVETTTGPLGQGVGNAVGMAMAARRERGLFNPEAGPGASPFDHHIYAFCSDGDVQEGVSHEASALAGTQQLGNLIMIWDDNRISIEDDTRIAHSEDVAERYRAYGWHVEEVDWSATGEYVEDVEALFQAIVRGKAETQRPTFIRLRTVIGWPAPNKQNTGAIHGAAIGADEISATKAILGLPDEPFAVEDAVIEHTRRAVDRGREARAAWEVEFRAWHESAGEHAELFDRLVEKRLPEGWEKALPTFEASEKGMATRKASGEVLSALAPLLPELWGGSADLAGSNNTTPKGEPSFLPFDRASEMFPGSPYGRVLHFGVREHGMGSILNGMALHGPTRPYGGTFLVFSDYMRPAVRLAAIMQLPVTYVWTHDSIGLGEDGPTHQPVEHLWALRAIYGLDVIRPADANETAVVWREVIERGDRPSALALTRQNLPVLDREEYASAEGAVKGGYVLAEADGGSPEVIIMATGSEVQIALDARKALQEAGTPTRVVSMTCVEWFERQSEEYREQVLPSSVRARVSVEAGIALGWREYVGDAGESVSLEHYGASAPYQVLYEKFGFTTEAVVEAARKSIARAGS